MDALKGLDALFVTTPANVRYLTGFTGVEPAEREAYVLLTRDSTYLFTTHLYMEHAATLPAKPTCIGLSHDLPISKALQRIADERRIRTIGFEDGNLTVAELSRLSAVLSGVSLTPAGCRIEELRMIKREDELKNIRLASDITDQCFSFILKRIRPGVTEGKLAWEIESFFKARAGNNAFSPIVAFNEHSSMPHYMARGNNPLRKGSLVLLDFGAKVNGYAADMTRMVFLGTPKPEWAHAYAAVLAANGKAISMLKDGIRNGATLDAAAREVIAEAGLPVYPHSLGHAVGLEIHEAPRLTVHKEAMLSPGMAVTVEPGTYLEGRFGIRIEDLVAVKKNSIELLSKSPKTLTVV